MFSTISGWRDIKNSHGIISFERGGHWWCGAAGGVETGFGIRRESLTWNSFPYFQGKSWLGLQDLLAAASLLNVWERHRTTHHWLLGLYIATDSRDPNRRRPPQDAVTSRHLVTQRIVCKYNRFFENWI